MSRGKQGGIFLPAAQQLLVAEGHTPVGIDCADDRTDVLSGRKAVGRILRGMDKGETIAEMSLKWKLPQGFVEQVCRIRVTHPGVTAEGIVNKMEVNELRGR